MGTFLCLLFGNGLVSRSALFRITELRIAAFFVDETRKRDHLSGYGKSEPVADSPCFTSAAGAHCYEDQRLRSDEYRNAFPSQQVLKSDHSRRDLQWMVLADL